MPSLFLETFKSNKETVISMRYEVVAILVFAQHVHNVCGNTS